MLLLLVGILAAVFLVTWSVMGTVGWALVVATGVLAGGLAIGASTDPTDVD